jgi:oligopeptide transport system substrate-binding protein
LQRFTLNLEEPIQAHSRGIEGTMKRFHSALFIVVLPTLIGCSTCEEVPGYLGCIDPPQDNVLRVAWPGDPAGLDPTRYSEDIAWRAARMLFEGLLDLTPEGRLSPGIAERWEANEGATRYEFYLRQDARWSDGVPVTAADFAFAWRRVLDPSIGAESAESLHQIRGARSITEGEADPSTLGVTVQGEHILVVELEGPDPSFPFRVVLPAFFPLPRHVVQSAYETWPGSEPPVGNGPFVLETWRPRDRLIVRKSDTYWNRQAIHVDGAVFYPITDANAVMNLYRSGELDWTRQGTVPPDRAKQLLAAGSAELQVSSMHAVYYLEFNTRRSPTDDLRVRRALELTVPRDEIARGIFGSGQRPTRHLVNTAMAEWSPPEIDPGDAGEARRLLAEAGYPNGEGMGEIEYLYSPSELHANVAEYLQGVWAQELGVEVKLTVLEFQAQLESARRGDFHLSRSGWLADLPDPYDYLKIFRTGNENNDTGWSDPQYDELIGRSRGVANQARRYEMLAEAERILLNDAVIVPILHNAGVQLIRPYVSGIRPSANDIVDWTDVRIDPEWRPSR